MPYIKARLPNGRIYPYRVQEGCRVWEASEMTDADYLLYSKDKPPVVDIVMHDGDNDFNPSKPRNWNWDRLHIAFLMGFACAALISLSRWLF